MVLLYMIEPYVVCFSFVFVCWLVLWGGGGGGVACLFRILVEFVVLGVFWYVFFPHTPQVV